MPSDLLPTQDLWDLLKVQPDHFARTTPAKHKDGLFGCRMLEGQQQGLTNDTDFALGLFNTSE